MPWVSIYTNLSKEKVESVVDLSDSIAAVLSVSMNTPKPAYIIHIIPDQMMFHGGNNEPIACSNITCVTKLTPEMNLEVSKSFSDLLNDKLNVSPDRHLISFDQKELHNVGHHGITKLQEFKARGLI
jgi:hypothetical protein